jgi:hypothetical protein
MNGKVPRKNESLTDPNFAPHPKPHSRWDYAGVFDGDYVKVDCDDSETFEKLISQCRDNKLKFNAVRTSRGGHLYFKANGLKHNRKTQPAVCGAVCEWKFATSNDTVPIKRDGKLLEWLEGSPENADIDDLPFWLFPATELIKNILPSWFPVNIPRGERNDTLFRIGCSMRAKGQTEAQILNALNIVNQTCNPPEKAQVIRTLAKQAAKYELPATSSGPKLEFKRVADLQQTNLPPLKWIVKDLLPQGLTLLASPPKYGKSWLVLDLCLSVATGEDFLNHRTTERGCFYLALEDSERRIQDRINRLTLGNIVPDDFGFAIVAPTLDTQLIKQLEQIVEQNPNTDLIVIDTLQKIRGAVNSKETSYASDYREISMLKTFADKHKIAVILVHHVRKMGDDDVFNRISGTNGLMGAADTIMVLDRKLRSDAYTTLSVTGRDVEPMDFILQFDKDNTKWKLVGTTEEIDEREMAEEYENNPVVHTIRRLLEDGSDWSGSMSDLLEACIEFTGKLPYGIEAIDKRGAMILGRKIKALIPLLKRRDDIHYQFSSSNNTKRNHVFRR